MKGRGSPARSAAGRSTTAGSIRNWRCDSPLEPSDAEDGRDLVPRRPSLYPSPACGGGQGWGGGGGAMLKMRVIPCLDVKDGRVVKGVNFVDLTDAGDPVEQARIYDREGADELCFLDITASHEGRDTLYDVVRRTAEQCFMPLTVGGGCARSRTSASCSSSVPTRCRSTPRR